MESLKQPSSSAQLGEVFSWRRFPLRNQTRVSLKYLWLAVYGHHVCWPSLCVLGVGYVHNTYVSLLVERNANWLRNSAE